MRVWPDPQQAGTVEWVPRVSHLSRVSVINATYTVGLDRVADEYLMEHTSEKHGCFNVKSISSSAIEPSFILRNNSTATNSSPTANHLVLRFVRNFSQCSISAQGRSPEKMAQARGCNGPTPTITRLSLLTLTLSPLIIHTWWIVKEAHPCVIVCGVWGGATGGTQKQFKGHWLVWNATNHNSQKITMQNYISPKKDLQ